MTAWNKAQIKAEIRVILIDLAIQGSTITYGGLVRLIPHSGLIGGGGPMLWDILGEISEEENLSRGVLLSALVVNSETADCGNGYFFPMAKEAGRDVSDKHGCWVKEIKEIHKVYRLAA